MTEETDLEERRRLIQGLLDNASMPQEMKSYYSVNLADLVQTYIGCDKSWRENDRFKKVNYFENEEMFLKLQSYARQGRIIATEGSIDDLQFLSEHAVPVSVIDASNIHDYKQLDIQVPHVRLIWTKRDNRNRYGIFYFSCLHTPLTPQEKEECRQLLEQLKSKWSYLKEIAPIETEPFVKILESCMASERDVSFIWAKEPAKIFDLMPHSSYSRQSMQLYRQCLATPDW